MLELFTILGIIALLVIIKATVHYLIEKRRFDLQTMQEDILQMEQENDQNRRIQEVQSRRSD